MRPLDSVTRLAIDRTRLGLRAHHDGVDQDRCLAHLVWLHDIRDSFSTEIKGTPPDQHWIGPRGFALVMISTALVSLAMAGIQHHESLRLVKQEYGTIPRSVAGPVAALVAFLGVCALISVIARL